MCVQLMSLPFLVSNKRINRLIKQNFHLNANVKLKSNSDFFCMDASEDKDKKDRKMLSDSFVTEIQKGSGQWNISVF